MNEMEIHIDKSVELEPHQKWICTYLDSLNEKQKICPEGVLPSDLIRGAIATSLNTKDNPDWMAQASHSYREILYGLGGVKNQGILFNLKIEFFSCLSKIGFKQKNMSTFLKAKTKADRISEVMKVLHEEKRAAQIAETLYKIHLAFTKISHHFSENKSKSDTVKIFKKLGIPVNTANFPTERDFINLVRAFENTLKQSSLDPLKIHDKINSFLISPDKESSYLRLLFSLSYDAKRYYFSQADETQLDWLWTEGFLNEIKKKSDDINSYSYQLPELEYLIKISEERSVKVAEIIGAVKISEENFNPEVVDRFIWIINSLPAEQIKTLTAKIKNEKWIYLMRNFRKSGYEFERIFKKLTEKSYDDSIMELAQAVFLVKGKQEISEKSRGFGIDDPFYVSDLDASGVFEALANVGDQNKEKSLRIVTEVMSEVMRLSIKNDTKVFQYSDVFSLYDIDFFTLKIGGERGYSYREDLKNLAATIKELIQDIIAKKCDQPKDVKQVLELIEAIPSCRAMWRLKLFTLAQCPSVFKDELKNAFFRIFEVENYYDIESGTEYQKALKIGFSYLSDTDQRTYVAKIFSYFSEKIEKSPDEVWHKRIGWEILSSICGNLTEAEAKRCKEVFGSNCNESYVPEPSVTGGMAGIVNHKSPVDITTFTVAQIAENLRTEWTQEILSEQFRNDDFHNPRGVEGLADAIKEDVSTRVNEYIDNIQLFFARDVIHPAYVYSLLRGIENMLRNKKTLSLIQIRQLLDFFNLIREEGQTKAFKRKEGSSWLADWIEVHKVIADTLLYILEDKKKDEIQTKYREQIKELISYLMTITDSPSKDHEKPEYGEPYHIAINSVRGRTYEVFVGFTQNDGEILAEDTKALYKEFLSDHSLAIRFIIGRYLATFYFRDKDFINELLPQIFPKDVPTQKDLYLASWEGYLSNTLYDKLFVDLSDYYDHAISLDPKTYTDRKYSKGLDESLAVHMALAYAHLGLEVTDPLFKKFWSISNKERHQEFISFIGKNCLTRDQAGDEWLEKNKVSKDKLLKFWDWAIENITEPEAFSGFGMWINPSKEVLNDSEVIERISESLKKANGNINWDYGLMKRLPIFAEKDPDRTLEIINNFLLDSTANLNQHRRAPLFSIDNEIKEALDVVYKNGDDTMKQKVVDLVNLLIEKGSSTFWGLKDVLN